MESEELEQAPKSFSLSKSERLRSRKVIQRMFSSKSSDFIFPFKYLCVADTLLPQHQILVSIPKKAFKRSVDRHLLARRVKEAYRLHKHTLTSTSKCYIVFIYVAKEILTFKEIEKKVYLMLQRINKVDNENKS